MLGVTSFFLGMINVRYLTNIRDLDAEQAFRKIIDTHHEVEKYHDLRSVIIDDTHTVVVAEVELREEVMIPNMRERIEVHEQGILRELPENRRSEKLIEYAETRAVIQATLERTEEIIDELESDLKSICPQVSHLTIEVEGIAVSSKVEDAGRELPDSRPAFGL